MERFTLTTIAILLFATITKAQITKGSFYLGGSIGASSTKQENSNSPVEGKSKWLSVNPAVGIAVKNNLIAGVDLNYLHYTTREFQNSQDNDRNGYGAGIFLRKYFPISNRFYVFGQTGIGYFSQKNEYLQSTGYSYTSTNEQHSVSANIYPGVAIHVFKSFYLDAAFNNLLQIGYSTSTSTRNSNGSTDTWKQKDFGIQSSLSNASYLNIGVRFIIPKK
jgi:hypothetical protein